MSDVPLDKDVFCQHGLPVAVFCQSCRALKVAITENVVKVNLPHIPVWVKWVDSSSRSGWHEADATVQLMTVESIGWRIAEDEKTVTIALSGVFDGSSTHSWGHLLSIPQCAIVDIRKLPQP